MKANLPKTRGELRLPWWIMMLTAPVIGCGGADPVGTLPVVVAITPARDTLTAGTDGSFIAAVDGTSDHEVEWRVQEGETGGNVSPAGVYTAGATAGVFHLIATSRAAPASADTAIVLVVAAPAAAISAPASVTSGATGLVASVPLESGMTYRWTITGGTITGSSTGSSVLFAAGAVGTLTLNCTVTNLAGATASATSNVTVQPAPPAPSIQSWTSSRAKVTVGQTVTLTANFSNGSGSVNQGIGSVTSGVPFTTGGLTQSTTFTLTVTGSSGAPATASLTIGVIPPPFIGSFDPISRAVASGAPAYLVAAYAADAAGSVSIDHGVGSLATFGTPVITTGPLSTTTTFTLSVRNSADSVVTDTATVVVQPPAPGAFASAGSLGTPRQWFSATRLVDGRVLIAGGAGSTDGSTANELRSVELYDPATNGVTSAGQLSAELVAHAAVRLQDGRVLFTNGTSAEIYDPASGTFSATGSMTESRSGHAMALLPDGRVLVVGGGTSISPSAELFDPSSGTFAPTGSMITSRFDFLTAPLPDGRVLIAGGRTSSGGSTTLAEVYHPSSGTFSSVGSMARPHWNGTATVLADGRVLIVGGQLGIADPENDVAEIFDPATNQFTTTGVMAIPRSEHTATLRSDGTVLIAGGLHHRLGFVPATEVYDAATGEFRPAAALARPRYRHAAAQTGPGEVTIFGGLHSSGFILGESEQFQ